MKLLRALHRRFPYFLNFIRACKQTTKHIIQRIYYGLYFRLVESHWIHGLKLYVTWAREPLPTDYIHKIQRLGKMFSKFVGECGLCLDVGCGNGMIGGKSYDEIGYKYVDGNKTIGLDPLPLDAEKPSWLLEYTRGVGECLAFKNEAFDTVLIATSLDHLKDVDTCFKECARVLKRNGTLNIWFSSLKQLPTFDPYHPNRITDEDVFRMLENNGWAINKKFQEAWSENADTIFIKATRNG